MFKGGHASRTPWNHQPDDWRNQQFDEKNFNEDPKIDLFPKFRDAYKGEFSSAFRHLWWGANDNFFSRFLFWGGVDGKNGWNFNYIWKSYFTVLVKCSLPKKFSVFFSKKQGMYKP